ncbi:MAG: winged helix-turn-helix domain-containing protein [Candidatus Bathyarchaeia archaeon]
MIKRVQSNEQNKVRSIDVEVLEGLALCGPKNTSKVAAKLNMPNATLRRRINHLRSQFSLFLQGNIYHTNIGLRKVAVFAESKPGYEELLYECLKCNDYWLYLSQCVGSPKCLAVYGIPAGREKEFEGFLEKLQQIDSMCSVKFYFSTCFQNVNVTSTWFDNTSEEWTFSWDSWLKEAIMNKKELPYTLKDPDDYPQRADWIDIMILKELEKNCAIKLKDIARMLGISLQRVKYHIDNHITKEKMFEGPQILADHFKGLSPDTYFFRFVFSNYDNLAKFASSLLDKPFVRTVGKVYGRNQLLVQVYLPRQQLRNLVQALSKLVRAGFLNTYEYVIQDMAKAQRDTIPYQLFKENKWLYDHAAHLEKLQSTVNRFLKAA